MTITTVKAREATIIESVGLVKINKAFVKSIKLKLIIELIAEGLT